MTGLSVWDDLIGQERVVRTLSSAVRSEVPAHAYLFLGSAGSGRKTAARALACALVCDEGGCGKCATCGRVKRGSHPAVREFAPEGAATYIIEQVRDILHDASLAPAEGSRSVYILDRADSFNEAAANAFLKTLEEPPPHVFIVLLASLLEAIPATVISRCQVIKFRRPTPEEALALLSERTGVSEGEAAIALAAAGGVLARAREYLDSAQRRATRERTVSVLKDLTLYDEHDTLLAARDMLASVKASVEELKSAQAKEVRELTETLGADPAKELASQHKRRLGALEREGVGDVLNVAEGWLRDCLALSLGVGDAVSNHDVTDVIDKVAHSITPDAVLRALAAVREARRRVSYNVTPQLAVEAMLFDVREALTCPR